MQEVTVEYTRQLTPDVLAGLRLYGAVTGATKPDSEEGAISRWRYWFEKNPHAAGFFAVAKSEDRVVGFRSIIPLAMWVKGEKLLGGKGEFFVVDPVFRRGVVKGSKQLLPVAIQAGLRDWAYGQGLQAHFGVGTPAATAIALLTGGKLIEFPCLVHTFPFEETWSTQASRAKHNAAVRGLLCAMMPLARQWARLRCPHVSGSKLEEVPSFAATETGADQDRNQFVAADAKSLDFRFPSDRYVKLLAKAEHTQPAAFVFLKPANDADVCLLYWSTLRGAATSLLCLAVMEMIGRCAKAGARKLTIVLPDSDTEASAALRKLGFHARRGTESVSLHLSDPQLNTEFAPERWAFNLAHQRFYQEG